MAVFSQERCQAALTEQIEKEFSDLQELPSDSLVMIDDGTSADVTVLKTQGIQQQISNTWMSGFSSKQAKQEYAAFRRYGHMVIKGDGLSFGTHGFLDDQFLYPCAHKTGCTVPLVRSYRGGLGLVDVLPVKQQITVGTDAVRAYLQKNMHPEVFQAVVPSFIFGTMSVARDDPQLGWWEARKIGRRVKGVSRSRESGGFFYLAERDRISWGLGCAEGYQLSILHNMFVHMTHYAGDAGDIFPNVSKPYYATDDPLTAASHVSEIFAAPYRDVVRDTTRKMLEKRLME